jgi:prepilin-type N-terminal cleavage/methylation domain-containing protein
MKTRGFTLLEILVVLAILGMGMALITEMTSVAARHSERVEEDTIVQLACENMMNSILAGNGDDRHIDAYSRRA